MADEEKTKISLQYKNIVTDLYMDNNLIERHGGVEIIEQYIKLSVCSLYCDLLVPELREELGKIGADALEMKLKILDQIMEEDDKEKLPELLS